MFHECIDLNLLKIIILVAAATWQNKTRGNNPVIINMCHIMGYIRSKNFHRATNKLNFKGFYFRTVGVSTNPS